MPVVRARLARGPLVFWASLLSCAAMALLGLAAHWALAALAMLLYGAAWLAGASTLQVAAQLAAPAWVRARALGVYQLCFFGALAFGAMVWGWVGAVLGLPVALGLCAGLSVAAAVAVRPWQLDGTVPSAGSRAALAAVQLPRPKAPAAELTDLLHDRSGRVLELVRYCMDSAEREAFLTVMAEVRRVRLRSGALAWRLYEDVAHPERFAEIWVVESWTEHLRETSRLDESDRATLARAAALHHGAGLPEAARYLNVVP